MTRVECSEEEKKELAEEVAKAFVEACRGVSDDFLAIANFHVRRRLNMDIADAIKYKPREFYEVFTDLFTNWVWNVIINRVFEILERKGVEFSPMDVVRWFRGEEEVI